MSQTHGRNLNFNKKIKLKMPGKEDTFLLLWTEMTTVMKKITFIIPGRSFMLGVLLSLAFFHASAEDLEFVSRDTLYGKNLHVMGRHVVDGKTLELISSGSHFGVAFEGTECTIVVSLGPAQQHSYIQYELDGVYGKRLRVNGSVTDTLTITTYTLEKHTLKIYKTTEASTGPIFIHQVIGANITSLPTPELPIIEFIGNSITCGAAADPSEIGCGTGLYHDQHNAYLAYGPRVARSVNANFVLSSVSGIGIYRFWNKDRPTMPAVYDKTDFKDEGTRLWDFNTFTPQLVSIALGTNDLSVGDGKTSRAPFDSAIFAREYIKFIHFVKTKYPGAKILLLNSPMKSGKNNDILVDCLRRVKQRIDVSYKRDKPVELFLFNGLQPGGCTNHPNVYDHEQMAEQLAPFVARLIKE
jgi:hypothetical protein